MTANSVVIEQPDALSLEEELFDFTADLLTLKVNLSFLEVVLAQPQGQWVNVATAVQDLEISSETLQALEAAAKGQLQVTWLNHPETSDDYCLVLFFMESLNWNNLAVYHRKLISKPIEE